MKARTLDISLKTATMELILKEGNMIIDHYPIRLTTIILLLANIITECLSARLRRSQQTDLWLHSDQVLRLVRSADYEKHEG